MDTEEWKGRQDLKKPLHQAKEFTLFHNEEQKEIFKKCIFQTFIKVGQWHTQSYLGDGGQGKPGQLNKTLSQNQKGKNKRAMYGYSSCMYVWIQLMYVCMYGHNSVVVGEQEEKDEDEQGNFCLHINGQLFFKIPRLGKARWYACSLGTQEVKAGRSRA